MDKSKYLTITEAANILGISRVAVFKKIKSGKIKATMIGHLYIISRKEFGSDLNEPLSEAQKQIIRMGVKKTVKEYGKTLEMLGKE